MTKEECFEIAKNRVSFVCLRTAELRKNQGQFMVGQRDAMTQANAEWRERHSVGEG
jgi:hypothetical protein